MMLKSNMQILESKGKIDMADFGEEFDGEKNISLSQLEKMDNFERVSVCCKVSSITPIIVVNGKREVIVMKVQPK